MLLKASSLVRVHRRPRLGQRGVLGRHARKARGEDRVLARLGRRSADQRLSGSAIRWRSATASIWSTSSSDIPPRRWRASSPRRPPARATEGGAVDLIWINGENFASMKAQDLLFGLRGGPAERYVDTGKPTTLVDFTVPTDGLEAPGAWPSSCSSTTPPPSRRRRARSRLLEWIKVNPAASPIRRLRLHRQHLPEARAAELTDRPEALVVDREVTSPVTAPLWAGSRRVPSSGAKAQAIRSPARRSISCWTTARSTSPWRSIRPKRRRRSARSSARDGAHLHPGGRHHRQHPLRRDPVQRRPPGRGVVVADFLMSPEAGAQAGSAGGATARCSTSMLWRRRIAPASMPCRSASRRCRPTR